MLRLFSPSPSNSEKIVSTVSGQTNRWAPANRSLFSSRAVSRVRSVVLSTYRITRANSIWAARHPAENVVPRIGRLRLVWIRSPGTFPEAFSPLRLGETAGGWPLRECERLSGGRNLPESTCIPSGNPTYSIALCDGGCEALWERICFSLSLSLSLSLSFFLIVSLSETWRLQPRCNPEDRRNKSDANLVLILCPMLAASSYPIKTLTSC